MEMTRIMNARNGDETHHERAYYKCVMDRLDNAAAAADDTQLFERGFRSACGLFPTGVTVVTRRSESGRPYGMTVSSFTSVSLRPPLILVCIDKRAGFGAKLAAGTDFAVNVLRDDQQQTASRFASVPESGRFESVEWTEGMAGVPLLSGVVATFTCRAESVVEAGDHFVVIGLVLKLSQHTGRALVWCESAYHCLPSGLAIRPPEDPKSL